MPTYEVPLLSVAAVIAGIAGYWLGCLRRAAVSRLAAGLSAPQAGAAAPVAGLTASSSAPVPLVESDALYRLTVETMKQGLAVLDGEARILYANESLALILGRPRTELVGAPFVAFFDDTAQGVLNEQIALRQRGERGLYELAYITPLGERLTGLISAAPLLDEAGGFICSIAVITDITARKDAELAVLEQQLKLRALAADLFLTEERERRRLASELHDHIGQDLALARIKLDALLDAALEPEQALIASAAREFVGQALDDARSLTFEVSPPVLHELGLAAALKWLATRTAEQHKLDVECRIEEWREELTEEVRVLFFQAARELLFNALKHAQASRVELALSTQEQQARLTISDDGVGFDPVAALTRSSHAKGYGLYSIRERLQYIGGECAIESAPGAGARITISAPVSGGPFAGRAPSFSTPAAGEENPIRVVLADDQLLMRQGLRSVLDHEPGISVIGEASNGKEAIELTRELRPDVVLMDIDMPGVDGIAATRAIVHESPGVKVIGLSMFADRRYVAAMLTSGAAGYLLKDCAVADLARAIYAVDGDLTFLSPAVTRLVVEDMVTREATERASLDVLTTREREVLELTARGESVKSIALELDINPKTIYAFRASMMKKLGIDSQAELIKFALKEGLAGERQ